MHYPGEVEPCEDEEGVGFAVHFTPTTLTPTEVECRVRTDAQGCIQKPGHVLVQSAFTAEPAAMCLQTSMLTCVYASRGEQPVAACWPMGSGSPGGQVQLTSGRNRALQASV